MAEGVHSKQKCDITVVYLKNWHFRQIFQRKCSHPFILCWTKFYSAWPEHISWTFIENYITFWIVFFCPILFIALSPFETTPSHGIGPVIDYKTLNNCYSFPFWTFEQGDLSKVTMMVMMALMRTMMVMMLMVTMMMAMIALII